MSNQSSLPDRLSHALAMPDRGIVSLVDELLAVSSEQDLQLTWQAGRCYVNLRDNGKLPDRIEVSLPKSVVRAALARIAVLCNERSPNSVSPYGGQGEVTVDTNPAKAIRVTFVNTPDQQSLELASLRFGAIHQDGGPSLASVVEERVAGGARVCDPRLEDVNPSG
jgi:hypothetical protein